MRHLKIFGALGCLLMLSGCASLLNHGATEFACPRDEGGVVCLSASEVYEATANKSKVTAEDVAAIKGKDVPTPENAAAGGGNAPALAMTPHLPGAQHPRPIRTPAQVMRVWIAPWVAKDGHLNMPSYLFTEIEPRRWTFGQPAQVGVPALRPLEVRRRGESTAGGAAEGERTPKPLVSDFKP